MGMDLSMGGHLTHGSHVNFRELISVCILQVEKETGLIDYNQMREVALREKPKC